MPASSHDLTAVGSIDGQGRDGRPGATGPALRSGAMRLAAFVSPGRSLDATLDRVRTAEELGYDLVLDNHIANRDGLVTLAAYGAATDHVLLGTGVYPALLQSTLSLGQQAATLDELLSGRLVLGVGTSHREVVELWHGLPFPDKPVGTMREVVTGLRQLFREGRLGDFRFLGFTPRADLPIYLSALSPQMLRLAGELADGVVLWMCDPPYVRDVVVPEVAAGAERAGRDPAEVEIVAAVTCILTDEPGAALERFRQFAATYLGLPFYRAMLERSGWGEDLARFDAGRPVSEDLLRSLAGVGTAGEVRAKVEEYREAGVTVPGIGPMTAEGSATPEQTLESVA